MTSSEQSQQDRMIRVFVSSTFRDMQAERDYLVKFIFPQLRKLCGERDIVWGEVDLRWGITDEQKAEGKVLPICLEEIKRCRPYFIGILGNRYGWVPDEIPADLIEKEEWLKEHRDHSVTELEILHGVLKNPEMTKHAFFYFRDPLASVKVEEELAKEADYRPDTEESLKKLYILKESIRKKGFPVNENFSDPKALGEAVLKDMTEIINKIYPESSRPDPLDREASDHESYAKSRSAIYIGREEYFRKLDEHVGEDTQPLVITGESGSGKSALLSNWALRFRRNNTGTFLLMHFTGASSYSAGWTAMLRRIMGEFKRRFDIQQEIPDTHDELRRTFTNWLHMVSARGRIVLIIDALNQMEDHEGAPDLVWLPPVIPSNVRMILSTLPGRPLDEIKKRSWQTLNVEPLTKEERRLFIEKYLDQFTKSLHQDVITSIASQEQTSNPLFLKALLEEMRLFGRHEELNRQISYYLEAKSVPDLYCKILGRYEKDYETERPGLVKDIMTNIWASRRGLQESELLDILGTEGSPLPRAIFTPLFLAAEHSLVNYSGLINFSHGYLRKAVENAYLHSDEEKKVAHIKLASLLFKLGTIPRVSDELPWQLSQSGTWDTLVMVLTTPYFLLSAWETNQFDVMAYWTQLEANSVSMVEAYNSVIKNPESANSYYARVITKLLIDQGHTSESLSLVKYLTEIFSKSGNLYEYQESLGTQADLMYSLGYLNEALSLSKEQERICRELENKKGLQYSFANQSNIYYTRGELNEAMRLNKEQEDICRKIKDWNGLQSALGCQASILYTWGKYEESLKLSREQERICREMGDKASLSSSLGNQGWILKAMGELDEAMRLFMEKERICREIGDIKALAFSLLNQASVYSIRAEYDKALTLYKEQEEICRNIGYRDGLQSSFGGQAAIYFNRNDLDRAMQLYKEQETICRELENIDGLQSCLCGQGNIHWKMGKSDEALRSYKDSELICRKLGNKSGLSISLGNQAGIYFNRGEVDEALRLYKEETDLCRELGKKSKLSNSLGVQADIYYKREELDEAMKLYKEQEDLSREVGNNSSLSGSLEGQAMIKYERGEFDEGIRLYKEQENICRETGDESGLSASLTNQSICYDSKADVLSANGDFRGALESLMTSLAIRENIVINDPSEVKYKRNLAISYWKLAEICQESEAGEAGKWWLRAYQQLQSMKQLGMLDPSDEEVLQYAKTMADQHPSSTDTV